MPGVHQAVHLTPRTSAALTRQGLVVAQVTLIVMPPKPYLITRAFCPKNSTTMLKSISLSVIVEA